MKARKFFISTFIILAFFSCKKDTTIQETIVIPNGDFELWDNTSYLYNWQTNSCPACVPPYETNVVQKVTDAFHGQYAAKFIYNNVYSSWADNKFFISLHPDLLTGYIKANIAEGDTATIHVDLFAGNNIVDSGNFYAVSSMADYQKIEIPITQTSSVADSALIKITGGQKQNTELYVDDLVFLKNK